MTVHRPGAQSFLFEGRQVSFEEIYDVHWKMLCSVGNKITHDQEVTKDLVQDVFLSFLSRYHGKEIGNVSAYLIQALRHACFKWLRNGKIAERHVARMNTVIAENCTENEVDAVLLSEALAEAVARMPERPQQVFMLSRVENVSNHEIAQRLNIHQRTVENHLTKALQLLRSSLKITPFVLFISRLFI